MMRCQWLRSEEINLGIGRIVNVDAIGRSSAEPMRYMFGFHMESYAVTVEYPNETLFAAYQASRDREVTNGSHRKGHCG